MDRFSHFREYFKLQALVPRLCLAIGAPAIGFCSLIYMNAYCTRLLGTHNSCHGVAFVLRNSLGNVGEWKYHPEGALPSCHESDGWGGDTSRFSWVTGWLEAGTSCVFLCWPHPHPDAESRAGLLQLCGIDILD